ncbi:hypothetical protein LQV63_06075 [Paenibacillus profundus]|uniref:Uncharacterized protein n=1 Tax=Paenibacillus profundus TaxID=1173085 RepID=A0ABS8YBN7_9BACL|nr:hypothetical protein [Paenibacillus profundus]
MAWANNRIEMTKNVPLHHQMEPGRSFFVEGEVLAAKTLNLLEDTRS